VQFRAGHPLGANAREKGNGYPGFLQLTAARVLALRLDKPGRLDSLVILRQPSGAPKRPRRPTTTCKGPFRFRTISQGEFNR
jgi:hypothetical protein